MGIKRKVFDFITKRLIKLLRLNTGNKISCSLAALLNPTLSVSKENVNYVFSCPNELTRWRVETYFTKEPETIEWINSFKEGDVLFDIGANIGLYSIYAAKKGINVIAFEPESQNYALLNKNIYMNQCQNNVMCLNIALSDTDSIDYLYLPLFGAGGAINCLGSPMDENGELYNPIFKQGVVANSLDNFLLKSKFFPTHIKIDVDGIEPRVIKGAENTMKDQRLKSISIELNEELKDHLAIIENLRLKGFDLLHKKHSGMFDSGKYFKIFNYVFVRNG
ncbi:MAG: FkbM family methyltransferase [Candidatus Omnitrophica bacterium]|nr:FkbM family methyltransferase [Candidatus Omnitrophota bacterium]